MLVTDSAQPIIVKSESITKILTPARIKNACIKDGLVSRGLTCIMASSQASNLTSQYVDQKYNTNQNVTSRGQNRSTLSR